MVAEKPGNPVAETRFLVYLGACACATEPPPGVLLHEGVPLLPGARLDLVRTRSPWSPHRDHDRVIVGSHPARADVRLTGAPIRAEHLRLYLPKDVTRPVDLRAIVPGTTQVDGKDVGPHDWTPLSGGEEIRLGPYRFRYELDDSRRSTTPESGGSVSGIE